MQAIRTNSRYCGLRRRRINCFLRCSWWCWKGVLSKGEGGSNRTRPAINDWGPVPMVWAQVKEARGSQREGSIQTETSEKLDWVSVILMKWAVEIIEKARYSDQKDTGGNLKKEKQYHQGHTHRTFSYCLDIHSLSILLMIDWLLLLLILL